jgi:O-acetyl-ADP-ribose deacetylase (regulator of RNase III)
MERASMIIYRQTNLFDSDAQTLVNTVNCVGVMGKGIAKEFKSRDGEMFEAYKEICSKKQLQPGFLWLWRRKTPWVLNFPTKQHWKGPSKLKWIESGLDKFVKTYEEKKISSISFPKLGCGNGGLEWNIVRPVMEHYLSRVKIDVYIHDFDSAIGLPEHLVSWSPEASIPSTDEEFYKSISDLSILNQGVLRTMVGDDEYRVHSPISGEIAFTFGSSSVVIGQDELRGVWLGLQRGTVTRKEAEWFGEELNGALIDLLARLPFTKAFLVGKGQERELAVELVSGRNSHTATSDQESMFG